MAVAASGLPDTWESMVGELGGGERGRGRKRDRGREEKIKRWRERGREIERER